jgi:thiamine biosynthesis lipoprotein
MRDVEVARRDFQAMGTTCSVLVYAAAGHAGSLARLGRLRVQLLEGVWSRFRDESELSRLNSLAGTGPVIVSPDTYALVSAMRAAWQATAGAFDPTVLAAMRAQGYDRDFADVIVEQCLDVVASPAPGMQGVKIGENTVSLPAGVGLDPGAIGKGLAADIVVEELRAAGAHGVLVDLGGDMAFAGTPGADQEWRIGVVDERARLRRTGGSDRDQWLDFPAGIAHAGVATSTSLTRRWADARHHVLDPGTGSSTDERLVQATVTGPRAWECEAWATAVLVRPELVPSIPEEMTCLALGETSLGGLDETKVA